MLTDSRPPAEPPRPLPRWLAPAALLACLIFLYLETFALPCTPRAATGDQSIYLYDATRMLDGQAIYRDFDHFTTPGTSVVYLILFKIFGVRAWIPQAMLILLGTSIAWLSYSITSQLVSGAGALLPGFLFLTLPFTGYLDATHHWYSTLAATAALAVVMDRRTPMRVAVAGMLWGLATCFGQSLVLGALGLAAYLVWEGRRAKEARTLLLKKESALVASYGAPLVAFNSYFIWKAGWRPFLRNTVVFVAKYYPQDPYNAWGAYWKARPALRPLSTDWPDLPAWGLVTALLPLLYIAFVMYYGREARRLPHLPWEKLVLVNVTGISMLLTVASAAAYNRLYTVALPALILLVWFLDVPVKGIRLPVWGLWITVLVVGVAKPVITQTGWRGALELPTGRTAFLQRSLGLHDETEWLMQRTRPGDYFFGDQFIGFALRLRNPARVDFVTTTGYSTKEQVDTLARGMEEHQVRFLSWYPGLDKPVTPQNHLAPLRQELQDHYRIAATFANHNKVWERQP
jgi:hypothetical protein